MEGQVPFGICSAVVIHSWQMSHLLPAAVSALFRVCHPWKHGEGNFCRGAVQHLLIVPVFPETCDGLRKYHNIWKYKEGDGLIVTLSLYVLFGFLFYFFYLLNLKSDIGEHLPRADISISVSEASLMSSFCILFLLFLKKLKSINQLFVLWRQLFDFRMGFG